MSGLGVRALGWWRQPPRNDASTIMGLQTRWAPTLAVGIWAVSLVIGFAAGGVEIPVLYLASMLVMLAAVFVLLAAPGDPVVRWATYLIVVAPPAAVAMAVPALSHRPGMAYATLTGASVIITAFFAVRGRVLASWISFGLSLLVAVLAAKFYGPQPALLAAQLPNLAVQLMATIFAAIVRPRARQIYALRGQTERETALLAADEAALAVRDQQMARLDDGARPLLDLIASGRTLDDVEVRRCRLVEAQLRDNIRAPGFDDPTVADAAWDARAKGVRVLLLDDYDRIGDADVDDAIAAVSSELVAALAGAVSGDEVTVRLLPNGRAAFATLSVSRGGSVVRHDFDAAGRRI
ncbi:hypothetical protein [Gordonia sp. (in: high G+C Gram-positive bacteria)]|uniref:hypothetical protein n=1 Tax=Gordonia sp. (in: high G+C Gram-positive bacteria) TaxID=84139 RepID=UPI003C79211C